VATTVGTNEDFDVARRLGADEVINFRGEKVEAYVKRLTSGFGFDVVFDTVGGKNLTASMEAARSNGRLVTTNLI
jgi:NADPH2:quinone reductase